MSELGELIVCFVLAGCHVSDDCEHALRSGAGDCEARNGTGEELKSAPSGQA